MSGLDMIRRRGSSPCSVDSGASDSPRTDAMDGDAAASGAAAATKREQRNATRKLKTAEEFFHNVSTRDAAALLPAKLRSRRLFDSAPAVPGVWAPRWRVSSPAPLVSALTTATPTHSRRGVSRSRAAGRFRGLHPHRKGLVQSGAHGRSGGSCAARD